MACSTALRAFSLTFGDPLITRETVPRPTPARAATASSVGRAVGARRSPFMDVAPYSCCRAPAEAPGHLFCLRPQATTPDAFGIPESAVFGNSPLSLVVHVDQTETLAVTPGPLEIVQQRPGEVPLERNARLDGGVACAQVSVDVGHPVPVVDGAVLGEHVVEGGAVLRDDHWDARILLGDPGEDLHQAGVVDLPAHGGDRPPAVDERHVLAAHPRRAGVG